MNNKQVVWKTERIAEIFARLESKMIDTEVPGSRSYVITAPQLQALRHIAQHGPSTISAIADGLSISQPAATMLINRMQRRGLVKRRPRADDRRQAEVSLTRQAESLLRRMERARFDRLSVILEHMSPEERLQFLDSLQKFVAAALKACECTVEEVCLRCGKDHDPECVVNQIGRSNYYKQAQNSALRVR